MTLPNTPQPSVRERFEAAVAAHVSGSLLRDPAAQEVVDAYFDHLLALLARVPVARHGRPTPWLSAHEVQQLLVSMSLQCINNVAATCAAHLKSERPTMALEEWFDEHRSSPYPSAIERQELSRQSGLSDQQVKTWFVNKRARSKVGRS